MAAFLSVEYMTEATRTLQESDAFKNAILNVQLGLQFIVTDHPSDGELSYYLAIGDGEAEMSRGAHESADVTVTNSYDTAVGISKGELNTQMAFMTGKLKVTGDMAKLIMHQGVITQFAHALSDLAVEY